MAFKVVPPRLFVILAREAPVGVIFRRGPSKWTQLIRWDTGSDRFEAGQWVHAQVYPRWSDVWPDGSLVIYHASNYLRKPPTWTAISRPPYFTAVKFWPSGGGGLFDDERTYWLGAHTGGGCSTFEVRLMRDGWTPMDQWAPVGGKSRKNTHIERHWQTTSASKLVFADDPHAHSGGREPGRGWNYEEYALRLKESAPSIQLHDVEWADWDPRGRLVFARGGRIFAAARFADGKITEKELYDARQATPTAVEPPPIVIQPVKLRERPQRA